MHKFTRKTTVVTIAMVLLFAGGAYAYWTSTGSGTGTATTGPGTDTVTVVQTNAAISTLIPGGPSAALSGTLNNPTDGPLRVAAVTASVTGVDGAHSTCVFGDYKITGTAPVNADVLVNDTSTWSGLSINLNNTVDNQDACKGATVTITYASS